MPDVPPIKKGMKQEIKDWNRTWKALYFGGSKEGLLSGSIPSFLTNQPYVYAGFSEWGALWNLGTGMECEEIVKGLAEKLLYDPL